MQSDWPYLEALTHQQMNLARCWLDLGIEAMQRVLLAQAEGTKQLSEFCRGADRECSTASAGEALPPWVAAYRRSVAVGSEASVVCFKTVSKIQLEAYKALEDCIPLINGTLVDTLERVTQSSLAAPATEAPRRRAA